MTIAVLGASGRTGKLICEQAVKLGHKVIAIVRDSAKVSAIQGITAIEADVQNLDAMRSSLAGVDAVINCLGSNDLKKTTLQQIL